MRWIRSIPRGRTTSVRGDADMVAGCVNRRVVRRLLVRCYSEAAASAYRETRLKRASFFVIRGCDKRLKIRALPNSINAKLKALYVLFRFM